MSRSILAKSRDLDIDMMIENAQEASEFLKALSHEARLIILCLRHQQILIHGDNSEVERDLIWNHHDLGLAGDCNQWPVNCALREG